MIRLAAVGDIHYDRKSSGRMANFIKYLDQTADILLLAGDLTQVGNLVGAQTDRVVAIEIFPARPFLKLRQAAANEFRPHGLILWRVAGIILLNEKRLRELEGGSGHGTPGFSLGRGGAP